MALTGDLAQLHITDIIQLIHTTRQSGTLSVQGDKGESRIIFSNGYIVGANHLNSRVRIGSVLVSMKAITAEDLKFFLETQNKAGKDRKPLVNTLKQLGRLKDDVAFRALKKLIEITVVELISWKDGTFSFDTDAIAVSPDCTYHPGEMEQEQSFDAQMVLMDALRVYDERERDRMSGAEIPSDEDLYAEALPAEHSHHADLGKPVITADILGLADLERLENRIPVKVAMAEDFDPVAIHRTIIRKFLPDFSSGKQEEFVAFLKDAMDRGSYYEGTGSQKRHPVALILVSQDELLTHALMTVCKNDGISIFGVSQEPEIERVLEQCYRMSIQPVLVFDAPDAGAGLPEEEITALRLLIKSIHPNLSFIQFVPRSSYRYALECLGDCVRTVFPRPEKVAHRETFVADMIMFLEMFSSAARCILVDPNISSPADMLGLLKEKTVALRLLDNLDEISSCLLDAVSLSFERSILFSVEDSSLEPIKAIFRTRGGISTLNPDQLFTVPLGKYSVFDDVVGSGQVHYGESDDNVLYRHLFEKIGEPRNRKVLILPLKVRGQVRSLVCADFGQKELASGYADAFEVLAIHAGIILENVMCSQEIVKKAKK